MSIPTSFLKLPSNVVWGSVAMAMPNISTACASSRCALTKSSLQTMAAAAPSLVGQHWSLKSRKHRTIQQHFTLWAGHELWAHSWLAQLCRHRETESKDCSNCVYDSLQLFLRSALASFVIWVYSGKSVETQTNEKVSCALVQRFQIAVLWGVNARIQPFQS